MQKKYILLDRKSTRLNSSHSQISYAVLCLKKKVYEPIRHQPMVSDEPAIVDEFRLARCGFIQQFKQGTGGIVPIANQFHFFFFFSSGPPGRPLFSPAPPLSA